MLKRVYIGKIGQEYFNDFDLNLEPQRNHSLTKLGQVFFISLLPHLYPSDYNVLLSH